MTNKDTPWYTEPLSALRIRPSNIMKTDIPSWPEVSKYKIIDPSGSRVTNYRVSDIIDGYFTINETELNNLPEYWDESNVGKKWFCSYFLNELGINLSNINSLSKQNQLDDTYKGLELWDPFNNVKITNMRLYMQVPTYQDGTISEDNMSFKTILLKNTLGTEVNYTVNISTYDRNRAINPGEYDWFLESIPGYVNFYGLTGGNSNSDINYNKPPFISFIRYVGEMASASNTDTGSWGNTIESFNKTAKVTVIDNYLNVIVNGKSRLIIDSSGNIGLNNINPKYILDISSNDAVRLPVGDTSGRPDIVNDGLIRYNTDTKQFEGYSNDAWQGLGGVIDKNLDTKIVAEDTDTLRFITKNNEHLKIDSSGNINIGNNSWDNTKKLDISRNVNIGGDLNLYGDLNIQGSVIQKKTNITVEEKTSEQMIITNDGTGPALVVNQIGEEDIVNFKDDSKSAFKVKNNGLVGINIENPKYILDISDNGAIKLPLGNSSQRPLNPNNGLFRYNTDSNLFEGYVDNKWTSFGSSGTLQSDDLSNYLKTDNAGLSIFTESKERLNIDKSGNMFFGHSSDISDNPTFDISGSLKISQNLDVLGQVFFARGGALVLNESLQVANNNLYVRNGKVGIGTLTPHANLEVNGDVIINDNLIVKGLIKSASNLYEVIDENFSNVSIECANTLINLNNTDTDYAILKPEEGFQKNIFFDSNSGKKSIVYFGTNMIVGGGGYFTKLKFKHPGQSASLVFIGNKWRIINTGAFLLK